MENLFYTCNHFPELDKKYIDEAISHDYYKHYKPNLWKSHQRCSFIDTNFFKNLKKDLNCSNPEYLLWPRNTLYDWHVDGWGRQASLNIPLVSSEHALTFCREPLKGSFYKVYKVDYCLLKPTLLNVKKEHCVINYSNEDRYVINLSFNVFKFADIVDYLKNLEVSDY